MEDALAQISHPHPLHLDPCGINEVGRQMLIEVFPPVLVIHLKRFLYNPAAGGMVKVGKPIQLARSFKSHLVRFPSFSPTRQPMLRIIGGLVGPDNMVPTARQSKQPTGYTLYCLLYTVMSRRGTIRSTCST